MCLDDENEFTIYGVKVSYPRHSFDETMLQVSTVIMNQIYEKDDLLTKAKNIIHLVSAILTKLYYIPIYLLVLNVFIYTHCYLLCIADFKKENPNI